MNTTNSWMHLRSEDERYALPEALRKRDPLGARDCGWVEQMTPFVEACAQPDTWLLDPFCGFGSTLVAAASRGFRAVGVELSADRATLATERLAWLGIPGARCAVITGTVADAATREALAASSPERRFSVCLTNIPYFGCTGMPCADRQTPHQLYEEPHYEPYLQGLRDVFVGVHSLLEPGGWCIVMAQNLRVGRTFVPLAWDVARLLGERFSMHEERVLIYDKPAGGALAATAASNRAHEYALICRKQDTPVAQASGRTLLAQLSQAGFQFTVYGSFARALEGEQHVAPNDIDLLVPPDDKELSRLIQWLEAAGFCVESWNSRVTPPLSAAALAHRHYFRARRLHRSGERIQIDITSVADKATFDAQVFQAGQPGVSGVAAR